MDKDDSEREEILMFKKMICLTMAALMVLTLAACGEKSAESATTPATTEAPEMQQTQAPETQAPATEAPVETEQTQAPEGKTLVAYFSWSGNTQEMAAYLAKQTGGDLYEIQPQTPYPEDYGETGDIAQAERDNNARPEIANLPDSLDQYDTILVGYPIWWHTAPMVIGTFLESFDLSGKAVYPFTQSASMDVGQFENSMEFVRETAAGATVHDGLFVSPSNTAAMDAYLAENGLSN